MKSVKIIPDYMRTVAHAVGLVGIQRAAPKNWLGPFIQLI